MNKSALLQMILLAFLAALLTAACTGTGKRSSDNTVAAYEAALDTHAGQTAAIDSGLEAFRRTYADFTAERFIDRVGDLYAERFYFNDTLHTFTRRAELVDYMRRTAAGLSSSRITVHQVITEKTDVFVRWTMQFTTRVAGRDITSDSIGMSHLRFDEHGRIVLHQDYWDSGHALYAHLPIVGFFVRRARSSM